MPISAGVIWSMDFAAASIGERPSSLMIRSTFSTTTMASSTSRPIASTMANMVSMLIEKPNSPRSGERAQQHHRHRDGRDQGGADVSHEQPHHQEDQHDRLEQGLDHFTDGDPDERRGVVRIDDLEPGRKIAAHLHQLLLDPVGGGQGIGARLLAGPARCRWACRCTGSGYHRIPCLMRPVQCL